MYLKKCILLSSIVKTLPFSFFFFLEVPVKTGRSQGVEDKRSRHCPYLDTINRQNIFFIWSQIHIVTLLHLVLSCFISFYSRSVLDFDFEKLCSVSLSHINVYACLICGKYFQGLCGITINFLPRFKVICISNEKSYWPFWNNTDPDSFILY